MGNYLEATGGCLANRHKNAWEKDIAARMICTNNAAEGPFATVRAFLHIYPSLKLRTVATLSAAIVNGTHRPAHKVPHTLSLRGTLYDVSYAAACFLFQISFDAHEPNFEGSCAVKEV
jgi:hypothetical protein